MSFAPPSRTHHGSSHQGTSWFPLMVDIGLTLTFPQFAALCWCLPILVGAEADFPTPALNTGEAAEEAPEGAEPSSRQTRQSAAPESYSFQV